MQWVPNRRTGNRESPGAKSAATIPWNIQFATAGRTEMLATGLRSLEDRSWIWKKIRDGRAINIHIGLVYYCARCPSGIHSWVVSQRDMDRWSPNRIDTARTSTPTSLLWPAAEQYMLEAAARSPGSNRPWKAPAHCPAIHVAPIMLCVIQRETQANH